MIWMIFVIPFIKLKKKSINFSIKLITLIIVHTISSCKEPTPSVLDVVSDSGKLNFVDTSTVISFTLPDDSIRTDETTLNLLGIYNDPVFGISQSSVFTQIRLSAENLDFGNPSDLQIDSVILSLKYAGIYGKKTAQTIKVFELKEDMFSDSSYYSTKTFQYEPSEIGTINITPNITDSVNVGGINEPPQLRISLNNIIGEKLIKSPDASVYQSNANFLNYFKGIWIVSDSTAIPASGDGAILYFDLLNAYSKLTVYYRNIADTDTFKFDFLINDKCARTSHFNFNRSGTNIFSTDTVNGNNLIYIQSMGGAKAKIKLPFLENFVKNGKVAVNKAEIIFTAENNSSTDFSPHANLQLANIDSEGNTTFLIDFFEGSAHYGGTFDTTKQQYIFNITRHVQFLLTKQAEGENYNFGMYLMGSGKAVNANRTILKGNKNVTFRISYTPL